MNRIKKVQKELQTDILIIDNPVDIYYLTGQELSLGRLLVTPENATLFVDGRYYEGCKKNAPMTVELSRGYGPDSPFAKHWKYDGKRIGFDSEYTTVAVFYQLQDLKGELFPLKNPIKKIREVKEDEEIMLLRRSADLCVCGYDYVLTLLKEGITEEQVALELEIFWRKSGGESLAFSPHIAFGASSSQPHYHVSHKELRKNDIVLIDIGVILQHYHSDMTRVVFFGEPEKELEKIYHIVREAQMKALDLCRPGVKIEDIDRISRGWIADKGYEQFFPHSLGHGIGLETHELPTMSKNIQQPLVEGMVVTIEPGIYLPDLGGVRLEDTIVITKDGFESLTNRPISTELPVIYG